VSVSVSVRRRCDMLMSVANSKVRQRGGVPEVEDLCCGCDSNTPILSFCFCQQVALRSAQDQDEEQRRRAISSDVRSDACVRRSGGEEVGPNA